MHERFFTKKGKIILFVCVFSVLLVGGYNIIDEGRGQCWFSQESYEVVVKAIELRNRELSYDSRSQDEQPLGTSTDRFSEKLTPWTADGDIGGRTELDELQARAKCRQDSWL